jgi:chromosome segregation ATPase
LEVNLSTTNQPANEEPQGIRVECQDIQQTKEALNEQLLEANKKCQSLGAETQELRDISELQQARLQSLREELVAASKKLQDANQTNEDLREDLQERNQQYAERGETIASLRLRLQQFQDAQAANVQRIELLEDKLRRLRDINDKLEVDLKDAWKDSLEGHASTRAALQHMMNAREFDSQASRMAGRARSQEGPASISSAGVNRENIGEEEGGGAPARAAKRVKREEEIIDLTE